MSVLGGAGTWLLAARAQECHNRPVQYDPTRNVWTVSRFDDVLRVLRDTDTFATHCGLVAGGDEATQARVRRTVRDAFATLQVNALAELTRSMAGELVERIAARGECELIGDFALPIALTVVSAMLGIERDRFHDLRRWSTATLHSDDPAVSEHQRALYRAQAAEFRVFLTNHIAQLPSRPRDRYLAHFVTGEDNGEGLTPSEQENVSAFIIVAGSLTTSSLIGNSMLILLHDRAWQSRLRSEPQHISCFIEEVLRYDAPVQRTLRLTTRPVEMGGVLIPKGALLELMIASANRDPEKFAEADEFRIDRSPNEHVSFGFGRHLCLGAQLARLEAAIALEILLQRFPQVRRTDPRAPIDFGSTHFVRGPARLDLCFSSATKDT